MNVKVLRHTDFFDEIGLFDRRHHLKAIVLQTTSTVLPANLVQEYWIGLKRMQKLVSPHHPIPIILDVRSLNFFHLMGENLGHALQLAEVLNKTEHILYPHVRNCTVIIGKEPNQKLASLVIQMLHFSHQIKCKVDVVVY